MGNTRRFAVLVILVAAFVTFVWLVRQGQQQQAPADRDETISASQPSVLSKAASPPSATVESPAPPPPAKPSGLTIKGRVVNARNEAVRGASVMVHHADRRLERTSSDAAGAFEVTGLSPGDYRVSASAPHYNEVVLDAVAAGSDAVRLALEERSSAWGTVRRADTGDPIEEFEMAYLVQPPGDQKHWARVARSTATRWVAFRGTQGVFNVNDVASNAPFAVAARALGFEPAYVTVPAAAPGQAAGPVDIQLAMEAVVQGRIFSPAYEPVAGASIHFGSDTRGSAVASSDEGGQFMLRGLGDEKVVVSADHPGYLPGSAEVTPVRGQTTQLDIVLGQGGTVEGTIWRGGDPVRDQPVIVSRSTGDAFRKETTSGPNGRYAVSGIPPGEVEVVVNLRDREDRAPLRLPQKAVVEANETVTIDFRFPALFGAIEGMITIDGAPPVKAQVKGTLAAAGGDSSFAVTVQDNGYYRVENLSSGRVSIEVSATSNQGLERRAHFTLDIGEGELVRRDVALDVEDPPG